MGQSVRPAVEWAVGIASSVLVAGLMLFLAWQALFDDARPPEIVVSVESIRQLDNVTTVTVAVTNRGDRAAASVTVFATVPDDAGRVAEKDLVLDYVAARSVGRGAFIFPGPVSPETLRLEIGSFTEP